MHHFLEISGIEDEDQFYKKYPTEDSFFKAYPQARNGYTFDDPYQPIGGTLDYNGVQPTQLPQNARGNDIIRYQSDNIQTYQPSAYQQQSQTPQQGNQGAAQASNWIGQAANIATDVIGGIGSVQRAIQVGAPQLLNALIPDNQPRRVNRPLIAENQYAYGTGSQMMYENGGGMYKKDKNVEAYADGGTIYEKGKEYTLTQEELKRLKDLGYEIEIY